jgi:hypothetical protein
MVEWMYRSIFLDLGASWRQVVNFTLRPLYTFEKEPPKPIGYDFGWAPEPVWTKWRSDNSCPQRDSNSDLLVIQPVASHGNDCTILVHTFPELGTMLGRFV